MREETARKRISKIFKNLEEELKASDIGTMGRSRDLHESMKKAETEIFRLLGERIFPCPECKGKGQIPEGL